MNDMSKLILIGSAPSSGSTMFADILDGSQHTACGPELEFFCNLRMYDFDDFKRNPRKVSALFSLRSTGIFPNYHRLKHYGMTSEDLWEMVASSKDFDDFTSKFSAHFLHFRNKSSDGIVFEKTPQNVNVMAEYLANPEHHFVYLVRHPLYVFNSLMNRGWGAYTALATWLAYAAKVYPMLQYENLVVIKLEDLVKDPFEITSKLINRFLQEHHVTADDLKVGFETNQYRMEASKKLASWEVNENSGLIIDPNKKEVSAQRKKIFHDAMDARISDSFARRFGIPRLDYKTAMQAFGYEAELMENSKGSFPDLSMKENYRYMAKTWRAVVNGTGKFSDFNTYRHVVDFSR